MSGEHQDAGVQLPVVLIEGQATQSYLQDSTVFVGTSARKSHVLLPTGVRLDPIVVPQKALEVPMEVQKASITDVTEFAPEEPVTRKILDWVITPYQKLEKIAQKQGWDGGQALFSSLHKAYRLGRLDTILSSGSALQIRSKSNEIASLMRDVRPDIRYVYERYLHCVNTLFDQTFTLEDEVFTSMSAGKQEEWIGWLAGSTGEWEQSIVTEWAKAELKRRFPVLADSSVPVAEKIDSMSNIVKHWINPYPEVLSAFRLVSWSLKDSVKQRPPEKQPPLYRQMQELVATSFARYSVKPAYKIAAHSLLTGPSKTRVQVSPGWNRLLDTKDRHSLPDNSLHARTSTYEIERRLRSKTLLPHEKPGRYIRTAYTRTELMPITAALSEACEEIAVARSGTLWESCMPHIARSLDVLRLRTRQLRLPMAEFSDVIAHAVEQMEDDTDLPNTWDLLQGIEISTDAASTILKVMEQKKGLSHALARRLLDQLPEDHPFRLAHKRKVEELVSLCTGTAAEVLGREGWIREIAGHVITVLPDGLPDHNMGFDLEFEPELVGIPSPDGIEVGFDVGGKVDLAEARISGMENLKYTVAWRDRFARVSEWMKLHRAKLISIHFHTDLPEDEALREWSGAIHQNLFGFDNDDYKMGIQNPTHEVRTALSYYIEENDQDFSGIGDGLNAYRFMDFLLLVSHAGPENTILPGDSADSFSAVTRCIARPDARAAAALVDRSPYASRIVRAPEPSDGDGEMRLIYLSLPDEEKIGFVRSFIATSVSDENSQSLLENTEFLKTLIADLYRIEPRSAREIVALADGLLKEYQDDTVVYATYADILQNIPPEYRRDVLSDLEPVYGEKFPVMFSVLMNTFGTRDMKDAWYESHKDLHVPDYTGQYHRALVSVFTPQERWYMNCRIMLRRGEDEPIESIFRDVMENDRLNFRQKLSVAKHWFRNAGHRQRALQSSLVLGRILQSGEAGEHPEHTRAFITKLLKKLPYSLLGHDDLKQVFLLDCQPRQLARTFLAICDTARRRSVIDFPQFLEDFLSDSFDNNKFVLYKIFGSQPEKKRFMWRILNRYVLNSRYPEGMKKEMAGNVFQYFENPFFSETSSVPVIADSVDPYLYHFNSGYPTVREYNPLDIHRQDD